MRELIGLAMFAVAGVGLLLLSVQCVSMRRHLRAPPARPGARPGISILKPLCGLDDDLAANLESFAAIDYPAFEVLLGVRDRADAAWPIACAAAARWPGLVRVVIQRGVPGENPKVNQLITLQARARHEIVVVSDSNIRVASDYLDEIAAALEDDEVGLVSHAIAGAGGERLGSRLDNLHLSSHVGPGVIASKRVAGKDVVVGKSMALRRRDLAALGGFEAVKDVLAEDHLLGKLVRERLGKRCALARRPIVNVSQRRSVGEFFRRYQRWSVIHRQAIGTPVYFCESFLNPLLYALAGLAAEPTLRALGAAGAVLAGKVALDLASARSLGDRAIRARSVLVVPAKDLLLAVAWAYGLLATRVIWRGNALRVLPGTRLERHPRRRRLASLVRVKA